MKSFLFVLAMSLFLLFTPFVFACEVIDDAGHKIILNHPAQRIISLVPDITEVLFAAGAGKHIIGVMQGSDYPPAAKKIPVVASYNSVDLERILSLYPDLIVAWTETSHVAQLKQLGIPVYFSHPRKFTDVAGTIEKLGCLAGTEKTAQQAANQYLQHYETLQKKYARVKRVSVFYQVWPQPLMTITKNSWINEVIVLCGGNNIFANLHGVAPEVSVEAVIAANPDMIIGTNKNNDWEKQWQAWPQLNAVKKHHLLSINSDLIDRAGPRLLDGAEQLCQLIHL